MHPLLKEGSDEAMRIFETIPQLELDWGKLRLNKLPMNLRDSEFIRVLKNSTRYISSKQLKTVFHYTISKFRDSIGDNKWFAVLNDDKTKSYSLFNLLLTLNMFPDMENSMQGIFLMSKKFDFPDSYSNYVYVSFDDIGVYPDKILFSMNNVKYFPRMVVTPFIGENTLKLLKDSGIDVIYGDKLRPFVKFDPLKINDSVEHKHESYPVLLPHRDLDEFVGFPEVYNIILSSPVKSPFASYTRYSYLVMDIIDQFVTII